MCQQRALQGCPGLQKHLAGGLVENLPRQSELAGPYWKKLSVDWRDGSEVQRLIAAPI